MVSNDWIATPPTTTAEDRAIARLIFEAGIETAGVVGGLFEMQFPFSIQVESSVAGVRLSLACDRKLPAAADRALRAAVKRCKGGPLELVISEPAIVYGSPDDPTAAGVHTYSVHNDALALAMPSDNLLGAKT